MGWDTSSSSTFPLPLPKWALLRKVLLPLWWTEPTSYFSRRRERSFWPISSSYGVVSAGGSGWVFTLLPNPRGGGTFISTSLGNLEGQAPCFTPEHLQHDLSDEAQDSTRWLNSSVWLSYLIFQVGQQSAHLTGVFWGWNERKRVKGTLPLV